MNNFMDFGLNRPKVTLWTRLMKHKKMLISLAIILLFIGIQYLVTLTKIPVYNTDQELMYYIDTNIGERVMEPPVLEEVPGYGYNWFDNPEGSGFEIHFPYRVEKPTAFYAKLDPNRYAILFETLGGSRIYGILASYGSEIEVPTAIPEKAGYSFEGWFSDRRCFVEFTFSTMPMGGATVYAKWEPLSYSIIFETDGGDLIAPLVADYQEEILLPTPNKVGFTFGGWYLDDTFLIEFQTVTMPLYGATIYAKWTPE